MKKIFYFLTLVIIGVVYSRHEVFADTLIYSTSTIVNPGGGYSNVANLDLGYLSTIPSSTYITATSHNTSGYGSGSDIYVNVFSDASYTTQIANDYAGTGGSGTSNISSSSISGLSGYYQLSVRGNCCSAAYSYITPFNIWTASSSFSSTTLSFVFPNATSTGLFSNWILSATNIVASDTYSINISWSACPVGSAQGNSNCTTDMINGGLYSGSSILSSGISIARTDWSFDFANNQTLYAQATLNDISNPTIYNTLVYVQGSWTLLTIPNSSPSSTLPDGGQYIYTSSTGNGTYSISTTTGDIAFNSNTSTVACSQWSTPGVGVFDIGDGILYAGCQLGHLLFYPSANFTDGIAIQVNSFQYVFPFNLFFAVVGGVEGDLQISASSTPQSLPLTVQGLNGQQLTVMTLTSSTLIDAITTPTTTSPFGGTINGCNTVCATHDISNAYLPIKIGVWITAGISIVLMVVGV